MRKLGLIWIVAVAGLAVVATAHASHPAGAQAAKKCKKKHHRAAAAKRKCGKRKAAPTIPAAAAPAPLTAAEVVNRVGERAAEYCTTGNMGCFDSGYYFDTAPDDPACESRTTYSWSCYGWNEDYVSGPLFNGNVLCTFVEVVERDGDSGIRSHQDLTFGGAPWGPGWDCEFE